MLVGSFVGALIPGSLSGILRRKRSIQIGSIIWLISSIIVCASQNIVMLIVGCFINGLSVGICSARFPVCVSEIPRQSRRSLVVGTQQWTITWGILIMFYISGGCSFINGVGAFRLPWVLQMTPAIIIFCGLFFTPESPRWMGIEIF